MRRADAHAKRIGDRHLFHPLASRSGCNVTRSYLPSPYKVSAAPESGNQRRDLMSQLMFADVEHAPKLHRTKLMVRY